MLVQGWRTVRQERGQRDVVEDGQSGHVGPAQSEGQLQVLLLLQPQPPQPLLLLTLALPLHPLQLLALISKLERRHKH
ncbi:hypothetical protein F7725_011234 [Dissostichus mawsoni]|uniref:Uncharacterized protein n=1 Tax=Dissostichus mawsoni TaxID=36200 RepID=A0A7J5Z8Z2_DISMA|nr:hypothetical protein F7725_011234 [Dissostichus mawsoni]